MPSFYGRWGESSLQTQPVCVERCEIINRILQHGRSFPWVFWELWFFMPEQDTFFILQKTLFQKCSLTRSIDYLGKDPHWSIMNQPTFGRIVPWSTLPKRHIPEGMTGVSLFLQHKARCIGYAKLGMGGASEEIAPWGDEIFVENLSHYKIVLEKEVRSLMDLQIQEGRNV